MSYKAGTHFRPFGTDSIGVITEIISVKGIKSAVYHYEHAPKTHYEMPLRELEDKTFLLNGYTKQFFNKLYGKMAGVKKYVPAAGKVVLMDYAEFDIEAAQ